MIKTIPIRYSTTHTSEAYTSNILRKINKIAETQTSSLIYLTAAPPSSIFKEKPNYTREPEDNGILVTQESGMKILVAAPQPRV